MIGIKHIYGCTSTGPMPVLANFHAEIAHCCAPTAKIAVDRTVVAADCRRAGCSCKRRPPLTVCAAAPAVQTLPQQQHHQQRRQQQHQQQQHQHQQSSVFRGLYTATSAHASGFLQASKLHRIYYEVHGNPRGVPAVVVHGGPGAGCFPNHARFFDPAHYRIILLDQRGCGRSTPTGCLADNTTADLVNDLELLRKALGLQRWLMLGGSWGVALSLAYAQAHPEKVLGLILRGVCLMRPREIEWMYGGGAAALKPLAWARFVETLPAREQGNPLLGYYKRLLSSDGGVRQAAAKSWMSWEMSVGFSNSQHLLVWDGQHWDSEPAPAFLQQQQQQQRVVLPPPPQPAGPAVAAAAGGLPALQRGACVPAGMFGGSSDCSSNRVMTLYNSNNHINTCTISEITSDPSGLAATTHSTAAAPTNGAVVSSRSSSTVPPHDNTHISPAAAGRRPRNSSSSGAKFAPAAVAPQPAWVWGLPGQGFNSQDPEVQQLIQSGLNHQGFSQGAAQALLECHYSLHGAFLLEQPLLEHIDRIRHIPCIAVQGQADYVCPPITAVELGRVWPEMELRLVPSAGHSMYDPAITHELVNATDRMRALRHQLLQQQQQQPLSAGVSHAW